MAPTITASTSTYLQRPGYLSSAPKKKTSSRSFKAKSGGLHNINLVLNTHRSKKPTKSSNSHIDLSNPHLPQRDKARLAQLEKTLPKLNGVVPAGVTKPGQGKKKGKKFVEDKESMLEILKMVNEVKEVQIEEKLEKGRQVEALREARRKEQEARDEQRKSKLDNAKEAIRQKRKGGKVNSKETDGNDESEAKPSSSPSKKRKRVSFA